MEHKSFSLYNWNIFRIMLEFFFPHIEHKESGKLFVSGDGALEFKLKHEPEHVFVYFDDDCDPVPCAPCDPGSEDYLDWRIVHCKHRHVLIIEWSVNTMRKIAWKVC